MRRSSTVLSSFSDFFRQVRQRRVHSISPHTGQATTPLCRVTDLRNVHPRTQNNEVLVSQLKAKVCLGELHTPLRNRRHVHSIPRLLRHPQDQVYLLRAV